MGRRRNLKPYVRRSGGCLQGRLPDPGISLWVEYADGIEAFAEDGPAPAGEIACTMRSKVSIPRHFNLPTVC